MKISGYLPKIKVNIYLSKDMKCYGAQSIQENQLFKQRGKYNRVKCFSLLPYENTFKREQS